ncbi:uncharacterized protein LOC108896317 isoform X2 [Lates japonicus]
MPTQKECHVCKTKIGVASKTCGHCGAKQPYKQKLENIKKKLDQTWKERQKKNSSVNKVYDATNLLLHKWELLERHPLLLLARRTTNGFLAECFCPWQMNAEDAKDALVTIKRIYESLLNEVSVSAEAAAGSRQSPAADSEETPPPDHHVLTADPASESTSSPEHSPQFDTKFTFVVAPGPSSLASPLPSSSQIPPVSSPPSLTCPTSSPSPTPLVSSSLASPVSPTLSVSPKPSSPVSTQLDGPDSLSSSWKRTQARRKLDPSDCPIHQGSTSFPYKQILGERIREGQAEVLVQWYPCSGWCVCYLTFTVLTATNKQTLLSVSVISDSEEAHS